MLFNLNADKAPWPKTPPLIIQFEITSSCNLNCIYCYAKPFTNKIMRFEDFKYLADKTYNEAKPFEFGILGGEPFLHPQILDIIEYSLGKFPSVGISTNGTLIWKLSKDDLIRLKYAVESGLDLQISLDSHISSIHDAVRGSFNLTLKSLYVLEKYNIPFTIGIVVTSVNAPTLIETVEWLITNFKNIEKIHFENVMPSVIMDRDLYYKLRLKDPIKFWRSITPKLAELSRKYNVYIDLPFTNNANLHYVMQNINYGLCLAGITRAIVKVDVQLYLVNWSIHLS